MPNVIKLLFLKRDCPQTSFITKSTNSSTGQSEEIHGREKLLVPELPTLLHATRCAISQQGVFQLCSLKDSACQINASLQHPASRDLGISRAAPPAPTNNDVTVYNVHAKFTLATQPAPPSLSNELIPYRPPPFPPVLHEPIYLFFLQAIINMPPSG